MYAPRLMLGNFIRYGRSLLQSFTLPEYPPLLTTVLFVQNTRSNVAEKGAWEHEAFYEIPVRIYFEVTASRVVDKVGSYDISVRSYQTHRELDVDNHFVQKSTLIKERLTFEETKSILRRREKAYLKAGMQVVRGLRWTPLHFSRAKKRSVKKINNG